MARQQTSRRNQTRSTRPTRFAGGRRQGGTGRGGRRAGGTGGSGG